MIPLIDVTEQSFSTVEELRETIAAQDRKAFDVPLRDISLGEDGVLRAGRFEGPLTRSALCGLVRTEDAPPAFVIDRCPADLQKTIIERLARERNISVLIQTVDGVATGVMPGNRRPIRHDILLDRLGVGRTIEEATLSHDCLRLTACVNPPREWLPNDAFRSGWELITSENGWHATRVVRRVVRLVCTNGMMAFDEAPVFERRYNSQEPVLASLQALSHALDHAVHEARLEPAVQWAANTPIGDQHTPVVDYLRRRLGNDAIKQELSDVRTDSSWYQLMNAVTASARLHSLELRRRYEIEGGILMNWFVRRGRTRPPWRRVACDDCSNWNSSPSADGQDVGDSRENAPTSLLN